MSSVATPGYPRRMSPNAPKTTPRQIRVGDERWEKLEKARVAGGYSDRASLVRDLMDWYLREPGVSMPVRPARAEWDACADG